MGLLLLMLCCPWPVSLHKKSESLFVSGAFVHFSRRCLSHYVIVHFEAVSGTAVLVRWLVHCADRFLLLKITQQENQPSFAMLRYLSLHSTPLHTTTILCCTAMFPARASKISCQIRRGKQECVIRSSMWNNDMNIKKQQ